MYKVNVTKAREYFADTELSPEERSLAFDVLQKYIVCNGSSNQISEHLLIDLELLEKVEPAKQ